VEEAAAGEEEEDEDEVMTDNHDHSLELWTVEVQPVVPNRPVVDGLAEAHPQEVVEAAAAQATETRESSHPDEKETAMATELHAKPLFVSAPERRDVLPRLVWGVAV